MRNARSCKWVLLSLLLLPGVSGCAVFFIGAAGVAGGYAVSRDGIEGITDKPYNEVWEAASNILNVQGRVEMSDKKRGVMHVKMGGSVVHFKMEKATSHSVVFRVQARKFFKMFPDMNLARRLYSVIAKEVK